MAKHKDHGREGESHRISAVASPAAAKAFGLRGVARGIHWTVAKQLLDLIEMTCTQDRQFQVARKQALDAINQGEALLMKAINDSFSEESA